MQKILRFWWVAVFVIIVIIIAATNWMGRQEAQDVTVSITIPASVAVSGSDIDKSAVLNVEPIVIERQQAGQDVKAEPAAKAVVIEEVDVEYEAPVRGPLTQ